MTRPNADQMRAVIRISGIIHGSDSDSMHGCIEVLMSPAADHRVKGDALAQLRKLGGAIARLCDEYERAEQPARACGT